MKLKNLMYATMIACAFTSCSKDEVIEGGEPAAQGTADLTLAFNVENAKGTKALGAEIVSEDKINTLAIYVYNEDKTAILAKAWVDDAPTTHTFKGLAAGQKVYCYAYANLAEEPKPTAPAAVLAFGAGAVVAIPADGFASNALPMAGESAVVALTADGQATATVSLERAVSRVDVVNLTLDITAGAGYNEGGIFNKDFSQAIFNTKSFSVNGVSTVATTAGANDDCKVFMGGLSEAEWGNSTKNGEKSFYLDKDFSSLANEELKKALSHSEQIAGEDGTPPAATSIYGSGKEATPLVSYYVLPNKSVGNAPVTLVLAGEFGYTVGNQAVAPSTSFYPIVIAQTGSVAGAGNGTGLITNNKVYRVSITVAGYGQSGGNKADLIVETKVLDYTPIVQNVVVE